jgi:hypothetical protein
MPDMRGAASVTADRAAIFFAGTNFFQKFAKPLQNTTACGIFTVLLPVNR